MQVSLVRLACLCAALAIAGADPCGYQAAGILSPKEDLCCPASCAQNCGKEVCAAGAAAAADQCCRPRKRLPQCNEFMAPPCAPPTLPPGWSLEYGTYGRNLSGCGPGCLRFTLQPPAAPGATAQGAYIYTDDFALAAKFCATISIQASVSGTIFALYATSGEPLNRDTELWDELDLEFTEPQPEAVWVNSFHKGSQQNPDGSFVGIFADLGARADNQGGPQTHTYCIEWDTTADAPQATWTRDGETLHELALDGWAKPMQAIISHWSTDCVAGGDDPCNFTGPLELPVPTHVYVTDVQWTNSAPAPMAPRDTYPGGRRQRGRQLRML
eukprot:TRINITY_DN1652_c3_g1_i1.p1 TRINITY_DN1652_c3_g1~~TRINITY_DN1652_c3_g1_i1.p1  ORF type:complete len:328 (+),score=88.02 TRINITY_DN1652_c3_g1_i1:222-1205(+)